MTPPMIHMNSTNLEMLVMVRERRMKENRNIDKQLRRWGQYRLVHEQGKVLELEAAADGGNRVGTEVGVEEEEEEEGMSRG
mmetsp:Transcript_25532/g.47968  ORF Transcript_25532/g.47968 Transcript_25532/m.47968 type:complete len:81 (+) Transcript_25532:2-244(+)